MKKIRFEQNGKTIEVLAQKIAGKLWLHFNGKTIEYIPEGQQTQKSLSGKNLNPHQIISPMPGKIIKVLKAPGDLVKKNETLVVMEAMKMEYNLKTTQDMRVAKINCQEGQTVNLAELLIQLEDIK